MIDGVLASAAAFVWTVALEFPVYALALPRMERCASAVLHTRCQSPHPSRAVRLGAGEQAAPGALAAAELAVALIEAGLLLLAIGPPRRFAWALLAAGSANSLSWGSSWLAQAL